jgi:hypothetical protein
MQMERQQSLGVVHEIILQHMLSFEDGSIHLKKARVKVEGLFGVDGAKDLFPEILAQVLLSPQ